MSCRRDNTSLTLLPSASRPVVSKSTDFENVGYSGGVFHFNVSSPTSSPTVGPTFEVQGREVTSGKYYTIATIGTTDSTSTGIRRVAVYPGASTAGGSALGVYEQENISTPLPHTFRVTSTSASTGALTFSVSVDLIG